MSPSTSRATAAPSVLPACCDSSDGQERSAASSRSVRGRIDAGRFDGIRKLQASRYNLLGPCNDDPTRATAISTRHVAAENRNFGEFKVPSLRNVARTAPYMHNGSLATLADVVRHYSEIDEERLHVDGERILKPLRLSPAETADLIAFLASLDDGGR